MKKVQENFDFIVTGGGVAGTVCAIAAARLGLKTLLLQNRPVLGGPSSSECTPESTGEFVNGASEYVNRAAGETGIIDELRRESSYRYQHGWRQHWSLVLREWCDQEPLLTLALNTEVYAVETADHRITALQARTLGSEVDWYVTAPQFADCSGDSFVGAAAGAEFRHGREAQSEFQESLAPPIADRKTMGSSIAFQAIDLGHPIKFQPPQWAYKINSDDDLPYRMHNDPRHGYWWLEYGGEIDTIYDNEAIYQKLLSVLYGMWDHVKNGADHGAANYAINWVSSVPGKRESRRLIGDYILTQNDVINHPDFPDTVAYGGWPIDIHPPEGVFGKGHPGTTPPFIFPGIVPIPYRTLYSRNITNLQMAGRNISVTHIALGTTRVMATCALCGQAIATAASLTKKYHCTPREIGQKHILELQKLLYSQDLFIPGVKVAESPQFQRVTASSEMTLSMSEPDSELPLVAPNRDPQIYDPCDVPPQDRRRGQMFPVQSGRLDQLQIKFNNRSGRQVSVQAVLYAAEAPGIFDRGTQLGSCLGVVPPGENVVANFNFQLTVSAPSSFVLLEPIPELAVCCHDRHLPGCYCKSDGCYFTNQNFCFAVTPAQKVFSPANVDGTPARCGLKSNMWISDPQAQLPQTLTLELESPRNCSGIELIFDTNVDKKSPQEVPPVCVKSYEVEARTAAGWQPIVHVVENHQRRNVHHLDLTQVEAFRLKVRETWGDASARLYNFKLLPVIQN